MSTFKNVTYDMFYKQAGEFFKATLDRTAVTQEQAEAGFKAVNLLYFGERPEPWTELQIQNAVHIINLAGKRVMEVEQAQLGENDVDL